MTKKIADGVTWVGKIDWELKHFHGDELSTEKGSSYNAYLVRDEKTVLIDTVWGPYDHEFVARLKKEIDLKDIDCIVMQHNESDHSGALPALMREIPETPIYCTAKGEAILRGLYHQNWNFKTVKTGDTLNIGKRTLTFIEAPMLHWPDTMFSYLSGTGILFSNDGFGQHFASESLFEDTVDEAVMIREAEKYFVNILHPFRGMVSRKIKEIEGLGVELNMICPSHGVIWRTQPQKIVDLYKKWAQDYAENQIVILYDTMWNSTRRMAEEIASGIEETDGETIVKLYNVAKEDKNDVLTEVFRSKAVIIGCPTINNGLSYAIDGILGMIKGLKFKGKKYAAFGSYGWSGEGIKLLGAKMEEAGFEAIGDGLRLAWRPNEEGDIACREMGKEIANATR